MHHRHIAVVLLLLASAAAPPPAAAQFAVSLAPDDPPQWDSAVQAGWFGGNKSDVAPEWNDWYDAASFSVSIGRYLTPHLKLEGDVAVSTTGRILHDNLVTFPGDLFPYYQPREHRFRTTQAGIGAAYQFFENRWFHPFAGGGLQVTRESERADRLVSPVYFRNPGIPVVLPPLDEVDIVETRVAPYVTAGFKAYVSERAFIRSDIRADATADRVESVVWRAGIGFDF
jgi:hypothetical protein